MTNPLYPFVAVVGQSRAKNALIYNLINPKIGGVLLSGEKGTAKSTLVRSISELTGDQKIIELPLNVTEDMLIGTIDMESAIKDGKKNLSPGILNKAHNNILYVDEVNLLSDSIINSLLDVSASGINKIEREGISFSHPSHFSLIGSMNPEEGGLRSEFLDRFGIYIDINGTINPEERKLIIKRRLQFEKSPLLFRESFHEETEKIKKQIINARKILDNIIVSEEALNIIANLSCKSFCAGHRAEITIVEIAKAIAAYNNLESIELDHIKEAATLALPHRLRAADKDKAANTDKTDKNKSIDNLKDKMTLEEYNHQEIKNTVKDEKTVSTKAKKKAIDVTEAEDQLVTVHEMLDLKDLNIINAQGSGKSANSGKRIKSVSNNKQGRYVGYRIPINKDYSDIALDATLKAAAPYQKNRKSGQGLVIKKEDIRVKIRENKAGTYILFVVDASGSMGANQRMKTTKEALLSLLYDAYQKRDKVGLISFRKDRADIILDFTNSIDLAQKKLQLLPTGGKTPLAAALVKSYQMIKRQKAKEPAMRPILVLVSDGVPTQALHNEDDLETEVLDAAKIIGAERIDTIVIDTERSYISLNLCKKIAGLTNGRYFKVNDLNSDNLKNIVIQGRNS